MCTLSSISYIHTQFLLFVLFHSFIEESEYTKHHLLSVSNRYLMSFFSVCKTSHFVRNDHANIQNTPTNIIVVIQLDICSILPATPPFSKSPCLVELNRSGVAVGADVGSVVMPNAEVDISIHGLSVGDNGPVISSVIGMSLLIL